MPFCGYIKKAMWDFQYTRIGRAKNNFFGDIYSVFQPPLPPSMIGAFGLDVSATYFANIFYYCLIPCFFPHPCDAILRCCNCYCVTPTATDTLVQSWNFMLEYAFPPILRARGLSLNHNQSLINLINPGEPQHNVTYRKDKDELV